MYIIIFSTPLQNASYIYIYILESFLGFKGTVESLSVLDLERKGIRKYINESTLSSLLKIGQVKKFLTWTETFDFEDTT